MSSPATDHRPALRGTLLAVLSAVAFGVSTPLVQRFGRDAGPFATATLLYGGAAVVGWVSRSSAEPALRRAYWSRLVAVAVLGAGLAPAALAWGLARSSGATASLMLNLEGVFTIVLARLCYSEQLGRRAASAAALLALGGGLLVLDSAHGGGSAHSSALGLVAVAVAALAWALDNTLAKPLSELDPAEVVAAKAVVGATLSAAGALALREAWPRPGATLALVAVGATGYGLSLRLYLRAQRGLGAGRTASVFASAPFFGALVAWTLGEPAGPYAVVAGAIMTVGLVLHMTERHRHVHIHEELEHDHSHRHDDGHHDHVHDPMPPGEHAHAHAHQRISHDHPHVPDVHHAHSHDEKQSVG